MSQNTEGLTLTPREVTLLRQAVALSVDARWPTKSDREALNDIYKKLSHLRQA